MSLQHSEDEDQTTYKVLVNHEEQYSIWPDYKENPVGWNETDKVGTKADCLEYVKGKWQDMRPLSLRKKMEEMAQNPPPPPATEPETPRESLVDRLATGEHPLVVSQRPEASAKDFKEAIDSGHARVKFTETKGGTDLGLTVDKEASDFSEADFEAGTGQVRLVGSLTLDYVKVRCIAKIDLSTLAGVGHLEKVDEAPAG